MVENSLADKPTHLSEVHSNGGKNLIYIKHCVRATGLVHLFKSKFAFHNIGGRYVTYGEVAELVKRIIPGAEIIGEQI